MAGNRTLLDIILRANELKNIPRMGWRVRGVRDGESVAEHSYAVALIVTLLGPRLSGKIDVSRAVRIALVHDLSEHMLGDIHAPASQLLGEDVKEAAELRVMLDLFGDDESAEEAVELWKEFAERSSVEGRFVRAIDKLEMFTQAYLYEQEGNRMLADFWDWPHNVRDFEFPEVRALYEELKALRKERPIGWAGRSGNDEA